MSTSINTNLASLFAQNSLSGAQNRLAGSVQRLSSGLRINSAKDDAAGLAIAQNMQSQINGVNQSIRNLSDATNLIQTTESALASVQDMLLRMKQLSTQGYNGSLSTVQKNAIRNEIADLDSEINATAKRTTFNGINLLSSSQSVDSKVGDVFEGQYLTTSATTLSSQGSLISSESYSLTGGTIGSGTSTYDVTIDNDSFKRGMVGTYRLTAADDQLTMSFTDAVTSEVTQQTLTVNKAAAGAVGSPTTTLQTLDFSDFGISLELSNVVATGGAEVLGANIAAIFDDETIVVAGQSSQITGIELDGVESSTYSFTNGSTKESTVMTFADMTTLTTAITINGLTLSTVGGTATADDIANIFSNSSTGRKSGDIVNASGNLTAGTYTLVGTVGDYDITDSPIAGKTIFTNSKVGNVTDLANVSNQYGGVTVTETVAGVAAGATAAYEVQTAVFSGTAGQGTKFTFNGLVLTTTANNTLSASDVAQLFANRTASTAITAESGNGWTLSGTATAYNSGAANGATVVYTAAAVGVLATETVTQGYAALAPTAVTTAGTTDNVLMMSYTDTDGIGKELSVTLDADNFTAGSDATIEFNNGIKLNVHNYQSQSAADIAYAISKLYGADNGVGTEGQLIVLNQETDNLSFQAGATAPSFIDVKTLNVMTGSTGTTMGTESEMTDVGSLITDDLAALTSTSSDDEWQSVFSTLSDAVDNAIDYISTQRAIYGSQINRLSFMTTNLQENSTNLQNSRSSIIDTDFAAETAALTKGQIMQQAATAMLAQANQMPNVILSLLK
jgi:flagellin